MKGLSADRRVNRTRDALRSALVSLLLKKSYEEITVQEIIDAANVGRSTFYAHYLDKDDLLIQGFSQVLDTLLTPAPEPAATSPGLPFTTADLFRHAQQHLDLYRALVRMGGLERISAGGKERLKAIALAHLSGRVPPQHRNSPTLSLTADFIAASVMSALIWWLSSGLPYSPEQMERTLQSLIGSGVEAILRQP